jgi:hypothetical protein
MARLSKVIALPKLDRDKRIQDSSGNLERLGHLQSLKVLSEQLSSSTKLVAQHNGAAFVESPHYEGRVDGGGLTASGDVNVDKFLKLCKDRRVPQEKINAVLKVNKTAITFLSDDDILSVSEKGGDPIPYRLTVNPRKDVPSLPLFEAIEQLHIDAFNGKIEENAAKKAA